MIRATDFLGVVKGKYDYLFFLVTDAYWLQSGGSNSLNYILEETFTRRLGRHGAVVSSFSDNVEENYQRVLAKEWPPKVKEVLQNPSDPKLLIIATDFDEFDPQGHRFALVDFREYRGDTEAFIDVLRAMEQVVTNGEDLFSWWETRASKSDSLLEREREAIELKPGIWGFSFDLRKFFKW